MTGHDAHKAVQTSLSEWVTANSLQTLYILDFFWLEMWPHVRFLPQLHVDCANVFGGSLYLDGFSYRFHGSFRTENNSDAAEE